MMNFVFLGLALVGLLLVFGPALVELMLTGVSAINFISPEDLWVFVPVIVLVTGLAVYMFIISVPKDSINVAVMVMVSIIVSLVLSVMICSLWADAWLVSYTATLAANTMILQIMSYAGWIMMALSAGWVCHVLYVRYHASSDEESGN